MDMEYQKDKIIAPAQGCEARGAATPHSRVSPSSTDKLFISGKAFGPNRKLINKYFPILVNRSNVSLYSLLMVIYSNPLRTVNGLVSHSIHNAQTVNKNLLILIDLGYVQQENKPRKVIPFNAFVIDKVYRITAKGVKVLSAITGY
jgi:hypothetical protein